MFVRRDLFEGKYAPDLEKQKQFELETNGNQRWDIRDAFVISKLNGLGLDLENSNTEPGAR